MHLFVDQFTNVDFSYLHPERGLVGETWLASVLLEGALDYQGMVCDFGMVKKTLRRWLDQTIDHSLLVAEASSRVNFRTLESNLTLEWKYGDNAGLNLNCSSPAQAVTLINTDQITPESVANWCIEQLRALLPESIGQIQLKFAPEVIHHHFYHYSHGLKKHSGNCQRIAHGHRSTIEIFRDSQRDTDLERDWCTLWKDVYIGTREDLQDQFTSGGVNYYRFGYKAQQGDFELTLASDKCYLIDTDSTVESIAQHIVNHFKLKYPGNRFKVKAFEGIGKGAIAFA